MSLDVGGLAKGFALDAIGDIAKDAGVTSFFVNIGGDTILGDGPVTADGLGNWRSGVEAPLIGDEIFTRTTIDILHLQNIAIATTGDYRRFFTIEDEIFGHTIDPRTLRPANNYLSVTILHESAFVAEMLSTPAFILEIDEAKALLNSFGAHGLWVLPDMSAVATDGYREFSTVLFSQ